MQTTFSIFALGFISAALGAESGHSPASAHPESIAVLTATPSPLVTESGFASQLHRASRPVLRRKESLMTTVLAAAAAAAAIVAVAFLVLQCFKAIGKASRASSSLRRLASGSAHGEGDCQMSISVIQTRCNYPSGPAQSVALYGDFARASYGGPAAFVFPSTGERSAVHSGLQNADGLDLNLTQDPVAGAPCFDCGCDAGMREVLLC
ncbi:hypothetical protein Emag_006360 [Eimeria magna]